MTLQDYLDNMIDASTKTLRMLIERSKSPLQITAAKMTILSRKTPSNLKLLEIRDEDMIDAQAEWEFDQQNERFWGIN
jgi:hypothetical protein